MAYFNAGRKTISGQRLGATGRNAMLGAAYTGGYGGGNVLPGGNVLSGNYTLGSGGVPGYVAPKVDASGPTDPVGLGEGVGKSLAPNYNQTGPVSTADRTFDDPANKYAFSPAWNDYMGDVVSNRMPINDMLSGSLPKRLGTAYTSYAGGPLGFGVKAINALATGVAGYSALNGYSQAIQDEIAGATRGVNGELLGPTGLPLSKEAIDALTAASGVAKSPWRYFGGTLKNSILGTGTPQTQPDAFTPNARSEALKAESLDNFTGPTPIGSSITASGNPTSTFGATPPTIAGISLSQTSPAATIDPRQAKINALIGPRNTTIDPLDAARLAAISGAESGLPGGRRQTIGGLRGMGGGLGGSRGTGYGAGQDGYGQSAGYK